MTPSPTVTDPSGGKTGARGDHWVDGSGESFSNPWSSFKDRVSIDQAPRDKAQDLVFLVHGFREFRASLSNTKTDQLVCIQGTLWPIHNLTQSYKPEFSCRLQRRR
jgi:hypothetical protein